MNRRLSTAVLAGSVGSLSCLLAACSASTDVSLTGNTPSQYSHVWITVQEVDFNQSATAGPSDSGWQKFSFSTPSTVDLVALSGGNLGQIASGLRIQPGTYSQVRLIPVDASAPLAASASSAGALYNSEADYVDSAGTTHQLPLELLNPAGGLGIATSIKVPFGNVGAALAGSGIGGGANTTTTEVTPTATQGTFASSADTTTTTSTGLGIGGTSSTSNQTPNSYVVFFDGTTDLVPFNYASGASGILLSQHGTAYDLSQSAGISGQLTLTNITTSTSGLPAIQVSAEQLSADGSRYEVVSTTTVQADGTFQLYPLAATTSSTGTFYDVVIHGPGIATIIIKNVELILPSCSSSLLSSSSSSNSNCSNSNSTTSTLGTTTTGTTTIGSTTIPTTTTGTTTTSTGTVNSAANNVVAIGTLTPRASSSSYTANVSTAAGTPLPAGARVEFLQTLGGQGQVPHVIETSTLDPFNQDLFNPQSLSTATIDSGTWLTSGGSVTIVSAAPAEGSGTYRVAAIAPSYNDGSLTPTVSAPSSGTGPVSVALATLTLAAGTSSGTVSATVAPVTPGKYNQGELLLSYAGTLVATTSLNGVIASGGTVTLSDVPAETPTSVYYATVRAWNSSDPSGTLQIQSFQTAVDLSGSASGSIQLAVN
jgi:trimeric autotransporter adhesin